MFLLFHFYCSIGGIKMSLKDKINKMIEMGFTFGQLGKICNCHPTSISKWIREEHKISTRMKESIENHIKSFIQKLEEVWSDNDAEIDR